jgi:hypothetical protein
MYMKTILIRAVLRVIHNLELSHPKDSRNILVIKFYLHNLEYDKISNNIGFNQVHIHATLVICPVDKSFSLTHSIYISASIKF